MPVKILSDDQFLDRFSQLGVDHVRTGIAIHYYTGRELTLAKEWLRQQKTKEKDQFHAP